MPHIFAARLIIRLTRADAQDLVRETSISAIQNLSVDGHFPAVYLSIALPYTKLFETMYQRHAMSLDLVFGNTDHWRANQPHQITKGKTSWEIHIGELIRQNPIDP